MDSDGGNQTRLTFNEAGDGWPTWSPNGQQIAFKSERDGNSEVYVMDVDGSNLRNLTRHPAFDSTPHWHPDGKRIAFMRGEDIGRLYTIDLDGNNLRLITEADFIGSPKWSPDGKRIAFEATFENENGIEGGIYVANANGRKPMAGVKTGRPVVHTSGRVVARWEKDSLYGNHQTACRWGRSSVFYVHRYTSSVKT